MKRSRAKQIFLILLAVYIGAWVLAVLLAVIDFTPSWVGTALLIYCFLPGPALLFLSGKDWLEELQFENAPGFGARLLRGMLGAPIGCFGLVGILGGLGLLGFSFWALFTGLEEWSLLKTVLSFPLWVSTIGIGVYFIRLAMNRTGTPTRIEIEKLESKLRRALASPDWNFYESHLGRPVPEAMRELYADPERISGEAEFGDDNWISTFLPIDEGSLIDTAAELNWKFDVLPFAFDGTGNPIYLRPGKAEKDCVFLTLHDDPEETEVLAPTVREFVNGLRWVKSTGTNTA